MVGNFCLPCIRLTKILALCQHYQIIWCSMPLILLCSGVQNNPRIFSSARLFNEFVTFQSQFWLSVILFNCSFICAHSCASLLYSKLSGGSYAYHFRLHNGSLPTPRDNHDHTCPAQVLCLFILFWIRLCTICLYCWSTGLSWSPSLPYWEAWSYTSCRKGGFKESCSRASLRLLQIVSPLTHCPLQA